MTSINARLRGPVLDAADPVGLARFYERLLGWPIAEQEEGWAKLISPDGFLKMEFQREEHYTPPVWPTRPGEPQMMMHLDIAVDDVEAGVAVALDAGATLAEHQPQDDVRVLLDPAGHPFCLFRLPT